MASHGNSDQNTSAKRPYNGKKIAKCPHRTTNQWEM